MRNIKLFLDNAGLTPVIYSFLSLVALYLGYWLKNAQITFYAKKIKFDKHPLFYNIKNSIREIENWKVPNNKQVFVDALLIKLKTWHRTGIKFTAKLYGKNVNSFNIEAEFMNWLESTIKQYIDTWTISGIPSKVGQYINTEHQPKVTSLTTKIHNIAISKLYINNYIRANVILETLDTLLSETKVDFLQLIHQEKLNGQFKGLTYKGFPISDFIK